MFAARSAFARGHNLLGSPEAPGERSCKEAAMPRPERQPRQSLRQLASVVPFPPPSECAMKGSSALYSAVSRPQQDVSIRVVLLPQKTLPQGPHLGFSPTDPVVPGSASTGACRGRYLGAHRGRGLGMPMRGPSQQAALSAELTQERAFHSIIAEPAVVATVRCVKDGAGNPTWQTAT